MATMEMATWSATLSLVRWRQTRRGYDADEDLLRTSFRLLQSDADGQFGPQSALRDAETRTNIPAARIATELLHFALLLVTKPRKTEAGTKTQSQSVLHLLHLALKALRATTAGPATNLSIPMNACNMILSAMAEALETRESNGDGDEEAKAVDDVLQVFVFLFGMTESMDQPGFNMYKPPPNVFSDFMLRACTAIFKLLQGSTRETETAPLVRVLHAILRVFQELQHTQVNKKKVFLTIAKTSFRDIVGYRHALRQCSSIDGVRDVVALLDRIIVDAVFDPEHLREYDGALVHLRMWKNPEEVGEDEDEGDGRKAKKAKRKHGENALSSTLVSYQRNLFDELKALLVDGAVDTGTKESIGALMQVLVSGYSTRIRAAALEKIEDTRADIKSSKKRVANVIASTSTAYTPFKFWAELCGLAFQALAEQPQLATLVVLSDALFQVLCDADVYRVTEDTEEQEQFHMMQQILSRLTALLLDRDGVATAMIASGVCNVLANAVKCTPNLINKALVPVFQMLGACSRQSIEAASSAMVALLHAYESMRLVDAFVRACCAVDDEDAAVAQGLQTTFAHTLTESALRRTFLTLPPGQLEILWRLLTDKLAVLCGSGDSDAVASKMALVRGLFALFIQEIHITPQNRAKIGDLVLATHDKLLATLTRRLTKAATAKPTFTTVERELFSLFGEFLALYDGLAPATRAQSLEVVLEALRTRLVPVLSSLLNGSDPLIVDAAAGVIKIGIHWLRRGSDSAEAATRDTAALIVDRVMQWQCWDAVAFYLPELVAGVSVEQGTQLFAALINSYLGQSGRSDQVAAARILRDAAFYEIQALQQVAPVVFTRVVSTASPDVVPKLFEYLLTVPQGYVDPSLPSCPSLLTTVLRLHLTTAKQPEEGKALTLIAHWIERLLIEITSKHSASSSTDKQLNQWVSFLVLDARVNDATSPLLRVAMQLGVPNHKAVASPLTQLLKQQSTRAVLTTAAVVEALAPLHQVAFASDFVTSLVAKVKTEPALLQLNQDSSFGLLTALVKFLDELRDASPLKHSIQALLNTHIGSALTVAMQSVVHNTNARHRQFFTTVCSCYRSIGSVVTLETFGCLLAVALASAQFDDAPLASLVLHTNKEEFRLLVSTLLQELRAPATARVIAALKALAFMLETDRKLSPSRRQLLSEVKTTFVERFIQVASQALAQPQTEETVATVIASLRVFVLFYCKAELFTWKPHELLQVFAGFEPLHALASSVSPSWTLSHVHQVWLLSYNLLMRIIRHHFASLVNAVPHVVAALTSLLRVLLVVAGDAGDGQNAAERTAHSLEWSSNLARIYGYLKPHDSALRKHVVYLLVPYLRGVTQGKLSLALQLKLRPGVFALLEICSLNEKEQLYASLDATGKSLLKSLDNQYKLSYRYVGKV